MQDSFFRILMKCSSVWIIFKVVDKSKKVGLGPVAGVKDCLLDV